MPAALGIPKRALPLSSCCQQLAQLMVQGDLTGVHAIFLSGPVTKLVEACLEYVSVTVLYCTWHDRLTPEFTSTASMTACESPGAMMWYWKNQLTFAIWLPAADCQSSQTTSEYLAKGGGVPSGSWSSGLKIYLAIKTPSSVLKMLS